MKSLSDAFEHTLKDLYYAENAVVKALQEATGAATHKDLKDALKHPPMRRRRMSNSFATFQNHRHKAGRRKMRCD